MLSMIDLCAGTGAFSLAFHDKVNIVFVNDIAEASKIIYDFQSASASEADKPHVHVPLTLKNLHDIEDKDIPHHDILTCGFACQPFSIAGAQKGFEDERSDIFWKILSILDYHKPSCVIMENVKNILTHNKGKSFDIIIKELTKRHYDVMYNILSTSEITGIPQHRERVYIIATAHALSNAHHDLDLDFDTVEKKPIKEFLETQPVADKYYYTPGASSVYPLLHKAVIKKDTVYQYRRVYVRCNKAGECPTLTANMGTGGHNVPIILDTKGIRKLTPRECFNLQGFPSTYILPSSLSDASLYKLAGNAVSYPIVRLIAERLIPYLSHM